MTSANSPALTIQLAAAAPLWHTFLVRAEVIQAVELCGDFKWRKKKGMGRDVPRNWIAQQVADGKELWFTLTFYEV